MNAVFGGKLDEFTTWFIMEKIYSQISLLIPMHKE